ncbi:MAG: hypothetical protein WDW38_001615 [Sanguina aurantia]
MADEPSLAGPGDDHFSLDLDLELDDLLSVKETTITHQTIDVNTLNKTLKFLIKRSQNGSIHPAVQAKLDKLEAANAELRNQIAHLAEEQEAARKRLDEKLSTDQYEAPAAIQVLDQRISRLEEAGSKAAADGAKAAADGAKAAGVPSDSSRDRKLADDDDASKDGAAEVADQRLADDDDASKDGAAEVAAAAAAAEAPTAVVAASATVGAGAGGGGGDGGGAGGVTPEQLEAVHARLKLLETQATDLVSDANKLRGLVGSKADRSELDAAMLDLVSDANKLRGLVGTKADRSELDAAMLGGRPAGGGSKITVSNGISSSTGGSSGGGGGEGGEVRDESVGEVSAGLDNLRSVVGALQERLRNKADAAETEEHRERLAGIGKEINQINVTMLTLSVPPSEPSTCPEGGRPPAPHSDPPCRIGRARFDELHSRVDALGNGRLPASASSPDLNGGGGGGGGDGMDTSELAMQLVTLQGQMEEMQHAMPFKADIDYLQVALSEKTKADGARMDVMEAHIAKKADAAALDALRLQMAMGAARAAVAGGGSGRDTSPPAGGGGEDILSTIQEMMQDKATNEELEAVRSALAGKPDSVELEAVRGALSRKAGAQEVEALRSAVAALTASMAGPHGGSSHSGMASVDDTNNRGSQVEIEALSDRMGDMYAEMDALKDALNRSVASQAPLSHEAVSSTHADLHGMVKALHALAADVKLVREARSPKGGYDRLVKRLGRGDYRHKMDAFDQDILARMAQKLTTLEVALRASGGAGRSAAIGGPGMDMGMKELEKQLRRATGDIRTLKAQMGAEGHQRLEGDHAMLASKPLTGYRCLACDRPLEKLDEARGPHIPSQVMPNPNYPETPLRANRFTQQPAKESSNLSTPSTAGGLRKTTAYDPSLRGPQNWYEGAHGAPADQLPREDVGPKLPGGGWRGMENVAAPLLFPSPKGTLPELAPGTSGAVGSTATPGPRSPQVLSHGYRSSPARTDTASTGRTTTAASQHHGSDSATGNRNLPSIL